MALTKQIQEQLTVPFTEAEVKFKPTAIKNGKALALAYVDARTILDRLDEVIGPENWHDEYEVISPTQVICKLTILGITKSDAGEAAEGEKEPLKSAVSDALKRAAVKFGIGRYLYRLPRSWCKFDQMKSEFVEKPNLTNKTQTNTLKIQDLHNIVDTAEGLEIPECAGCGEKITNRVAIFSKKYYQKPLCMKCQNQKMKEKESATIAE